MPAQIVMGLAGLWLVIHLSRTFDTKTYREWWYDNDTREMVETVAAMASSGDPVSLGVEWIFHPSAQFYVQTRHLPVRLAPYSKEVSKDNPVVYYYVHPEFVQQLEPEFSVEKNFGGKLLLRRVPETRRVNDQSDEQE